MKNYFAIIFLLWLSVPCLATLKIFYDPATDQIDHLQKLGAIRTEDYVNEADAHDFRKDHPDLSPKAIGLSFLRHAFEKGMVDELLGKAEFLSQMLKPEDKIVFLGRTSSMLGMIFAALQEARDISISNVINLNFSATPDMCNVREDNPQNDNMARNLVTAENLEFFESYLTSLGLDNVEGKLYIVDMIGTGSNLNSLLRILVHYYFTRNVPLPDINFVSLTFIDRVGILGKIKTGELVWRYGANQKKLAFAGFPQYGFRQMTVDAIPLGISYKTLHFLDTEDTAHFTAIGASFPAYRWNLADFQQLKKPYQGESSKIFNQFLVQVLHRAFREKLKPSESFRLEPNWEMIPELVDETYVEPGLQDCRQM